jgi:uncharacterized protein YbbC (DUF1343 family)
MMFKHSFFSKIVIIMLLSMLSLPACVQDANREQNKKETLQTAAAQTDIYIPLLKNKNVAVVANHSSLVANVHLVDTMLSLGLNIVKVFAPEHGFRGLADAGAHIKNETDPLSGLPIISLYGHNRKPGPETLSGIDIIVFDIQDVGARFYTYISTLSYIMEAAAEQDIEVLILDRPNPNGFYIDGPVMEEKHISFVGMHPVPIVYGMTIGEYGLMVNGENWLADSIKCDLRVIPLKNYERSNRYTLDVKPSPNLPTWQSVYLYPSLCLFEGTVVSVGRGTETPFSVYGHPDFVSGSYTFTPMPAPGAAHPKLSGKKCYGQNLEGYAAHYQEVDEHFNLSWLIGIYEVIGNDSTFFTPYFEKLAGTHKLREQIIKGVDWKDIKAGWQDDINAFKLIRKKYLIYEDF